MKLETTRHAQTTRHEELLRFLVLSLFSLSLNGRDGDRGGGNRDGERLGDPRLREPLPGPHLISTTTTGPLCSGPLILTSSAGPRCGQTGFLQPPENDCKTTSARFQKTWKNQDNEKRKKPQKCVNAKNNNAKGETRSKKSWKMKTKNAKNITGGQKRQNDKHNKNTAKQTALAPALRPQQWTRVRGRVAFVLRAQRSPCVFGYTYFAGEFLVAAFPQTVSRTSMPTTSLKLLFHLQRLCRARLGAARLCEVYGSDWPLKLHRRWLMSVL